MGFRRVPRRIITRGNDLLARSHIGEADSLLNLCETQAGFQNLQQFQMVRNLQDGSVIVARTYAGLSDVIIDSPFIIPKEERVPEVSIPAVPMGRFCVKVNLGDVSYPRFGYTKDGGFEFYEYDTDLALNRCASKLILKGGGAASKKIEYLVTQDSTMGGRVRILMDGTEEVDMPSISPPGDSLHYPVSGFIYDSDYVYMHTRQGPTQWKYSHIFGGPPADKGLGVMYELKGNSLEAPDWKFSDFGAYPETDNQINIPTISGASSFLGVAWYDGYCEGIVACYGDTDGDYCSVGGVGTSSISSMGYTSTMRNQSPSPFAISGGGTQVITARQKSIHTQREILQYVEDACVANPWGEEQGPHSIFQGWSATAEPIADYSLHEVNRSYSVVDGSVEKLTIILENDVDTPINAEWGISETTKASPSKSIVVGESHSSSITGVVVQGYPDDNVEGSETTERIRKIQFGGDIFEIAAWEKSWYGRTWRVPGSFQTTSETNIIYAQHSAPVYLFFSGDVPVLHSLDVYNHGGVSNLDDNYKTVFYDSQLHPVQNIAKVACHDMRQEGQPKLVAVYADTGWKVYIEDTDNNPHNVTEQFFSALNAYIGTSFTPASPEVEMFFICNINEDKLGALERDLFIKVNEYRVDMGKPALQPLAPLRKIARPHSDYMCVEGESSHDGWDGRNAAILEEYPYFDVRGENTAWRSNISTSGILQQWKNSPGHDANMLHDLYQYAGMGIALCEGGGMAATQLFAGIQE